MSFGFELSLLCRHVNKRRPFAQHKPTALPPQENLLERQTDTCKGDNRDAKLTHLHGGGFLFKGGDVAIFMERQQHMLHIEVWPGLLEASHKFDAKPCEMQLELRTCLPATEGFQVSGPK